MRSIDTNVFLYAINRDCPEHDAAKSFVRGALQEPAGWVVADQVWFELYRLLRNPAVLKNPLAAPQAADTIDWYRNSTGWLTCAWEPEMMKRLMPLWRDEAVPARSGFDSVLAVTLVAHGVDTLYTRNTKDFERFGLFHLSNPID